MPRLKQYDVHNRVLMWEVINFLHSLFSFSFRIMKNMIYVSNTTFISDGCPNNMIMLLGDISVVKYIHSTWHTYC